MNQFKSKENLINDWISTQLNTYNNANKEILTFIANILFQQGEASSEIIIKLFKEGYCYYFANMLKDAFEGEIYWNKKDEHIIWKDNNSNTYYDIEGVVSKLKKEDIINISFLGDDLESFRHRGKDFDILKEIEEYSFMLDKTLDEFMHLIYDKIPNDFKIFDYYNETDVFRYWNKYKKEL